MSQRNRDHLKESPLHRMLPENRKKRALAAAAAREATHYYPRPLEFSNASHLQSQHSKEADSREINVNRSKSENLESNESPLSPKKHSGERPVSASLSQYPQANTNLAWVRPIEMPLYPDDDEGLLSGSRAGSHNNMSLDSSFPMLQRSRSEVALLAPLKRVGSATRLNQSAPPTDIHPHAFVLDTHTASNTHHFKHLKRPHSTSKLYNSSAVSAKSLVQRTHQTLKDTSSPSPLQTSGSTVDASSMAPNVTYRQLLQPPGSSQAPVNYRSTTFAGTKYQFDLFDAIARYENEERQRQELEYTHRLLKWSRLKEGEVERQNQVAENAARKRKARAIRLATIDAIATEQLWQRETLETDERRTRAGAENNERQLRRKLRVEEWQDRTDIHFAQLRTEMIHLEVAIRSEACGHFIMDCEARFRNFRLKESTVTRTQLLAQEKSQRITQLKYLHRLWTFKAKQEAELVALSANERRSRARVAEEEGSAFSLIDIEKIGVLADVARAQRRAHEAHLAKLKAIEEENASRRQQLEVDDAEQRNTIRQEESALRSIFREQHIATRAIAEQNFCARVAAETEVWNEECRRQQQPIISTEEKARKSIALMALGDYNELMARHQEKWQNVLRPIDTNVTQVSVRYSPACAAPPQAAPQTSVTMGEGWLCPFSGVCLFRKASSSLYPAGPCTELRIEVKGVRGIHSGDEIDIPSNIAADAGLGAAKVLIGSASSNAKDKTLTKDQQWIVSGQQIVDGFGNTVCYFGSERTVGISANHRGGTDEDTLAHSMATNDLTLFWADVACSTASTVSGYVDALRVANRLLAIIGFRCDPSCTNVDTREVGLVIRANFAASLTIPSTSHTSDSRRVSAGRRRSASPSGLKGSGYARNSSGTEGSMPAAAHADLHIKGLIYIQAPSLHFGMWEPQHAVTPNPSITTTSAIPIYIPQVPSATEDILVYLQQHKVSGEALELLPKDEESDRVVLVPPADAHPSAPNGKYISFRATYVDAVAKGKQRAMPFATATIADGPDFASFSLKIVLSHIAGADDNLTFVGTVGGPNVASLLVSAPMNISAVSGSSPASLDLSAGSVPRRSGSAGRSRIGGNVSGSGLLGAGDSVGSEEAIGAASLVTENYILKRNEITATAVLQRPCSLDSITSLPTTALNNLPVTSHSVKSLEVQGRLHPTFPVASKEVIIVGTKTPRRVVEQVIRRIGGILDVGKFPKSRFIEATLSFTEGTTDSPTASQSMHAMLPARASRPVSASSASSTVAAILGSPLLSSQTNASPTLTSTIRAEIIPTTLIRSNDHAIDFGNSTAISSPPTSPIVSTSFALALPQSTLTPRIFIDNSLNLPQWFHTIASVNKLQLLRGARVARSMARAREAYSASLSALEGESAHVSSTQDQMPPCTITVTVEQGATAEDQLTIDFAQLALLRRRQEMGAAIIEAVQEDKVLLPLRNEDTDQYTYNAPLPSSWKIAIEGANIKYTSKAAPTLSAGVSPIRAGLSPIVSNNTSVQGSEGALVPMLEPANFEGSGHAASLVGPSPKAEGLSSPMTVIGTLSTSTIRQCQLQPELSLTFKGFVPGDVMETILQSIYFTTKANLTSANATKVIRISIVPPAGRRVGAPSPTRSFFPLNIPLTVITTGPRLRVDDRKGLASDSLGASGSAAYGSVTATSSALFTSMSALAGKATKAFDPVAVPVIRLLKLQSEEMQDSGDSLEPLCLHERIQLPDAAIEDIAVTIVDYMPQMADRAAELGSAPSIISPSKSLTDGADGFVVHTSEPSFSSVGSTKGDQSGKSNLVLDERQDLSEQALKSRLLFVGTHWRHRHAHPSVLLLPARQYASKQPNSSPRSACAFDIDPNSSSVTPLATARPIPESVEGAGTSLVPAAVVTSGNLEGPQISAQLLTERFINQQAVGLAHGISSSNVAFQLLKSVQYKHNFVSDVALLKTLLVQIRIEGGLVEEALLQIDVQPTYLPSYFTGMLERKLEIADPPNVALSNDITTVVVDDIITQAPSATTSSPPISLGATAVAREPIVAERVEDSPNVAPLPSAASPGIEHRIPYIGSSLLCDYTAGALRLFPNGTVADEDTTACGEGYFVLEVIEGIRPGDRLVLLDVEGATLTEFSSIPKERRSSARRGSVGTALMSHVMNTQYDSSLSSPQRTKIRSIESNELLAETDWSPMQLMADFNQLRRPSSAIDPALANEEEAISSHATKIVLNIAHGTVLSDCSKLLRMFGFSREDPYGYVEPHSIKCLLRFNARDEIVSDTRYPFTIDVACPPLYTLPVERTARSGTAGGGLLKPFANLKLAVPGNRSIGISLKVTIDQPLCQVTLQCPLLKQPTPSRRASASPAGRTNAAPDLAMDPSTGTLVCNFSLAKRLAGVNTMRPTPGVDGVILGKIVHLDDESENHVESRRLLNSPARSLSTFTPARNRPSSAASHDSKNGTPLIRTHSISKQTGRSAHQLQIILEPSVPCSLLRVILSHIVVNASRCRANPTATLLWDLYVQPSSRALRRALVPPVPEAEVFVSKVACDVEGEAAGVSVLQPNDRFIAFDGRSVKIFEGLVISPSVEEEDELEATDVSTAANTPTAMPLTNQKSPPLQSGSHSSLPPPSAAAASATTPRRPSVLQLRESQLLESANPSPENELLTVNYVEVNVLGARSADVIAFPSMSAKVLDGSSIPFLITLNDQEAGASSAAPSARRLPGASPNKKNGGLTPQPNMLYNGKGTGTLNVQSPTPARSRSSPVSIKRPESTTEEDKYMAKSMDKDTTEEAFSASASADSLPDRGFSLEVNTSTHVKVNFTHPQSLSVATALLNEVSFSSISRLSGPVRLLEAKVGLSNGRSITRQAQVSLRPRVLLLPARQRVLLPVVGEPSPVLKGVFATDQKLLSTATFTFTMLSAPLSKGRSLDRLGVLVKDGLMINSKTQTIHLAVPVPTPPNAAEDSAPSFAFGPILATVTAASDRDLTLAFSGASALSIAIITSILESVVLQYADDRSPGLQFDAKAAAESVKAGGSVAAALIKSEGFGLPSSPQNLRGSNRGLSPSINREQLKTPMAINLGSIPEACVAVRWECEVDRYSAFSSGKFVSDEVIVNILAPTKM